MKLSFIVPIYGVEPYLRKCVDSLLHQDYEDYEIILVDDGGKDGCPAICDEYAAKYDKIQVVHRENGGLSAARNSGIEVANGEYLCFVDSDDYWEENVLGGLMAQIERDQLDVLRFRWQNVRIIQNQQSAISNLQSTYEVFKPYKEENFVDFSSEPLNGLDYLNQRMGIQCYAWSFILRAELVKGERLKDGVERLQVGGEMFTEGILFEDTDWTPRMLAKANRVAGTDTIVYNYFWNDKGITLAKSSDKMKREVEDKLQIINRLKEWGSERIEDRGFGKNDWYSRMISALTISIINILGDQLYAKRQAYIRKIKSMQILPLNLNGLNHKAQRKAKIINISPKLAIELIHIVRR